MRRDHALIVLVLLGVALAVVARGRPATRAGDFTELHRAEVAGASELEVVMGLIERSGSSTSGKHYHPGGEFGFVLEGTATVSTENDPEAVLEAGDSFHQPAGE